jgi:hypothetical protein
METSNLTISERINNLPANYSRIFTNMREENINAGLVKALEVAYYIDLNGESGLETFGMKASAISEMTMNDVIRFLDFYRRNYSYFRTEGTTAVCDELKKLLYTLSDLD